MYARCASLPLPFLASRASGSVVLRCVAFERRSNTTHQSTTDPEALLAKKGKGKEARLSFMGHVLWNQKSTELSTGVSPQSVVDAVRR